MNENMEIKIIKAEFTVCNVADYSQVDMGQEFCFTGKTDEENSLVCLTENVPKNTVRRDDGWRAFRIQGVLDFSLREDIRLFDAIKHCEVNNDPFRDCRL